MERAMLPMLFAGLDEFGDQVLERVGESFRASEEQYQQLRPMVAFLSLGRGSDKGTAVTDGTGILADAAARLAAARPDHSEVRVVGGVRGQVAPLLLTLVADATRSASLSALTSLLTEFRSGIGTQLQERIRLQVILNTAAFGGEIRQREESKVKEGVEELWTCLEKDRLPCRLYLIGQGSRERIVCQEMRDVVETTAFFLEALLLSDLWNGALGDNPFFPKDGRSLAAFQAVCVRYPTQELLERLSHEGFCTIAEMVRAESKMADNTVSFPWPTQIPTPHQALPGQPAMPRSAPPQVLFGNIRPFHTDHGLLWKLQQTGVLFCDQYLNWVKGMPEVLSRQLLRVREVASETLRNWEQTLSDLRGRSGSAPNFVFQSRKLWKGIASQLKKAREQAAQGEKSGHSWTPIKEVSLALALEKAYRRMARLIETRPNALAVLVYFTVFLVIVFAIARLPLTMLYGSSKGTLWAFLLPAGYLLLIALLVVGVKWWRVARSPGGFFSDAHQRLTQARQSELNANASALEHHWRQKSLSFLHWRAEHQQRQAKELNALLECLQQEECEGMSSVDDWLPAIRLAVGVFTRLARDSMEDVRQTLERVRVADDRWEERVLSSWEQWKQTPEHPGQWVEGLRSHIRRYYSEALEVNLLAEQTDELARQLMTVSEGLVPLLAISEEERIGQPNWTGQVYAACNPHYEPVLTRANAGRQQGDIVRYDLARLNCIYLWTVDYDVPLESVQFS